MSTAIAPTLIYNNALLVFFVKLHVDNYRQGKFIV